MEFMKSGSTAADQVELLLLGFGTAHAYRVFSLSEVADAMPHISKELLRQSLERLADRGLLTRFAGRYCFNKDVPCDVRLSVEGSATNDGAAQLKGRSNAG